MGAAVGTLEEARARAARETRAPIENVFATFGILDESTSERLDSLLKNPPLRSTLETSAEVRVSVPEPVSAFALDDEDEDEGLTSIALSDAKVEREEWETIVREHASDASKMPSTPLWSRRDSFACDARKSWLCSTNRCAVLYINGLEASVRRQKSWSRRYRLAWRRHRNTSKK